MMDVLRFIFSSFWIWLGFTTLIAVVLHYLVDALMALCKGRTVKIHRIGDAYQIEIENASLDDIEEIIKARKLDTFEKIDQQ